VNSFFRVRNILREVFGDPTLEVREDSAITDFPEWDSIATVHIVLAIEAEFGVRFTTDQVAGLKSIPDLMKVLDNHTR
jgi:acyl carrier protein